MSLDLDSEIGNLVISLGQLSLSSRPNDTNLCDLNPGPRSLMMFSMRAMVACVKTVVAPFLKSRAGHRALLFHEA